MQYSCPEKTSLWAARSIAAAGIVAGIGGVALVLAVGRAGAAAPEIQLGVTAVGDVAGVIGAGQPRRERALGTIAAVIGAAVVGEAAAGGVAEIAALALVAPVVFRATAAK